VYLGTNTFNWVILFSKSAGIIDYFMVLYVTLIVYRPLAEYVDGLRILNRPTTVHLIHGKEPLSTSALSLISQKPFSNKTWILAS
jgi:hypothetical protein